MTIDTLTVRVERKIIERQDTSRGASTMTVASGTEDPPGRI
jgi:hypothetical protein